MWRHLVRSLTNQRGQTLNLFQQASPLLRNLLSTGAGFLSGTPQPQSPSFSDTLRQLLGVGLTGAGLLQPNDVSQNQGARTQAFQSLRNVFTSPNALTDQFKAQIGNLQPTMNQLFQPGQGEQFLRTTLQPGGYNTLLQQGAHGVQGVLGPETFGTGPGGQYLQGLLNPTNYNQLLGQTAGGVRTAFAPELAESPASRYLTGLLGQNNVGGVYNQYLPLIEQQNRDLFNSIQQRMVAGLPSSLSPGMSGPEIAAIREGFTREALPRQQALIADLGRESVARQMAASGTLLQNQESMRNFVGGQTQQGVSNQLNIGQNLLQDEANRRAQGLNLLNQGIGNQLGLGETLMGQENLPRQALLNLANQNVGRQLGAAGDILNFTQPDALSSLLPLLGLDMLNGRGGGGPGALPGQPGVAPGTQAGQPGTGSALQQFLGGGQGMGRFAPIGQLSAADIIRQVQMGSMTPTEGLALFGRTGLLPALGTGAAGYGVGQLASQVGRNQAQSALGGALGGAATGAAIGSVIPGLGTAIGAVVGGLGGLFGGFFGERRQQQELKESFRRADLDSQADQVQEIGSFFTQRLGALGGETSAFQQTIAQLMQESPGPGDEQTQAARLGGQVLLQRLQQVTPSLTSLNQVPGLRQEFIDALTGSTFTSGNSSFGGGPPLTSFPQWASAAGLARGGRLPYGGRAVVGERGPELLLAGPGTQVIPLLMGRT